MSKIKNSIFLLGVCFTLAACATKEAPIPTESKVILPPDALMVDCTIPVPPNKKEYVEAQWSVKEEMWADSIAQHYRSQRLCNQRLKALRQWKAQHLKAEANRKAKE